MSKESGAYLVEERTEAGDLHILLSDPYDPISDLYFLHPLLFLR